MEQVVASEFANYEVHFLFSDDPRHGFTVMSVNPPTFYEFQTPIGLRDTHTMVTGDGGAPIVTFNWFGPNALGTMTWPGPPPRQVHMGELVMPHQSMPDSRAFVCEGPDNVVRHFWWRRLEGGNYDLFAAREPAVCIGLFRKHHPPEQLEVGDSYATFFFNFLHRPLLVNALLALSLNRWHDSQDGPQ